MPGTPPTRFVYLGPEGTFTERRCAPSRPPSAGCARPARSVPEALEAVRSGDADAALVPLENSVGGAVPVTLDELATGSPLVITREVVLPVEFVLAAARLIAAGRDPDRRGAPAGVRPVPQLAAGQPARRRGGRRAVQRGRRDQRGRRRVRRGALRADRRAPQRAHRARREGGRPRRRGDPVRAAHPARPARRRRPATTSPRWPSRSGTTRSARCSRCSPSSRSAGSTCPGSSPGRPASSSGRTSSSSTAPATSPSPGSARRCRACAGSAPRSASWAATPGTGWHRSRRSQSPPRPVRRRLRRLGRLAGRPPRRRDLIDQGIGDDPNQVRGERQQLGPAQFPSRLPRMPPCCC